MCSVLMTLWSPAPRGTGHAWCSRCQETGQTMATSHYEAGLADFYGCASCGDLDLGGDLAEGM